MTFAEAKAHLCNRKLNADYSDIANNDLFSDTDLGEWINQAILKAWDYELWPFTQITLTQPTTFLGAANGYYNHPEDFMLGSIRRLTVGGKEYRPLRFEDYLKYKDEHPTDSERLWSFHEQFIFVNANAYTVGDDMDALGKGLAPKLSNASDLLPFSTVTDDKEHSGNEAIVQLAYGEALGSEKKNKPTEAEAERKKAYQMLQLLWKPFSEFNSNRQSQDRPMFDVPDFFSGRGNSSQNIGNFNL